MIHLLSREAQDIPSLLQGRITGEKLKELANGLIDIGTVDEAFLCGPEAMIGEARTALAALGVPVERIRSELFKASEPRRNFVARSLAEAAETEARRHRRSRWQAPRVRPPQGR